MMIAGQKSPDLLSVSQEMSPATRISRSSKQHIGEVNVPLNTIFSGTSGFPHNKRFADKKDANRNDNCEATKQFAKLRFNINIEAAKKTEMLK